jgi:hypothetical protein
VSTGFGRGSGLFSITAGSAGGGFCDPPQAHTRRDAKIARFMRIMTP